MPAGVQFLEPAEPALWGLPTTSTWAVANAAARAVPNEDVRVVIGSRGRQVRAAVRNANGAWRDSKVDSGTSLRGPAGYRVVDWIIANSAAASSRGFVVTGQASIADPLHHNLSRLGLTWFSRDGSSWSRTDLRTVLGSNAAFVPASVIATPSGWTMAGSLTSRNLRAKATIVVLTSTDGRHWARAGKQSSRWAVTARQLSSLGDGLVLSGYEWACEAEGFMLNAAIGSPVLRLWGSSDGGRTWKAGDSTAGGVVVPEAPMPTSARACTGGIGAYRTSGDFHGIVNGRAAVVSGDHARIATSTDLLHWQVGTLEGAIPAGGATYSTSAASSVVVAADGPGLAVLALGPRRDAQDRQAGYGSQIIAWQSGDGVTWSRVPSTRPLELTSGASLIPSPDGAVYLFDQRITRTTCGNQGCKYDAGPPTYRRGVAGPLAPPIPCDPAPGANCSFTTIASSPAGADLRGINLFGSEIAPSVDLAGVDLSKGRLIGLIVGTGVRLAGADLTGADLSGASIRNGVNLAGAGMRGATLTGATIATSDVAGLDLTGANLRSATLTAIDLSAVHVRQANFGGAFVNASYFRADRTGVRADSLFVRVGSGAAGLAKYGFGSAKLAGFFFSGANEEEPGDLRGADFRRAHVKGISFTNVDLTGARFPAGARSAVDFSGGLTINFSTGVTCPDGKPARKVTFSYDCRLGK